MEFIKTAATSTGFGLLFSYMGTIKDCISCVSSWVQGFYLNKATITLRCNIFAIKQELNAQITNPKNPIITNGQISIDFDSCNGPYKITYNETNFYFYVFDNKVEIYFYSLKNYPDLLVNLMKYINNEHISSGVSITFYSSIGAGWSDPQRRPSENVVNINNITNETLMVLNDFDKFKYKEYRYEQEKLPYRRGYFISGISGSGKSMIPRIIAKKYNMPIYQVNLNSDGMDDAVLITLIGNIPPYSIILFDEMEKQYKTLMKNKNVNISNAGILSAIDGANRLSHGTIVIMISNDINILDEEFFSQLLRKGRIDKHFVFKQIYPIYDIDDDSELSTLEIVDDPEELERFNKLNIDNNQKGLNNPEKFNITEEI